MRNRTIFKTISFALLDCLFCLLSWIGSVFVFTYLLTREYYFIADILRIAWIMAIACVLFYFVCGVYKSLWQHPGIGSIIRITTAALLTSFTGYVALRYAMEMVWPNPGLGMMAFYFLITMSAALRLYKKVWITLLHYVRRIFKMNQPQEQEPVRTLLVGGGNSASAFLLNPSQQGSRPRKIFGIVDIDGRKHGLQMHGVSVYGDDSKIPKLVRDFSIDEIVITVPTMANEDVRRIVSLNPSKTCKVRLLTGLSSDKSHDTLRDINIGDLLGRKEADLNEAGIATWLSNKTVLVTGGGGSIGSEICRQLMKYNVSKIVIFDVSENNMHNLKEELAITFGADGKYRVAGRVGSVQDEQRLDEVFTEFAPDIVFHAAAYKHVPLMEECPRLAIENNVQGTYRTAICACRHNVERFVMISTDKAVNPTNVMGASKRMSEILTLGRNGQSQTEFVCVRFGNVLDSNGSVIPKFKQQIEGGGPITVTHPDIIRYFMTITEAAKLVLDAGAMAAGGEIFILDMGEQVKIVDLAENLIRMANLTPHVDIKLEFIGLRPGEKLYEELLLDEEGLEKTQNDKIFVAKPVLPDNLGQLIEEIKTPPTDADGVREFLKKFVPEYQPTAQ